MELTPAAGAAPKGAQAANPSFPNGNGNVSNNRAAGEFPNASLYVGDLHTDVSEAMLFEKFNTAGSVASIRVCRDAITRRSLGYAYVNFHTAADATQALDMLNFEPLKGRPMRIMWSQRDPSLRKSNRGNIFIKNLDKGIDHKDLYDTFSAFGKILSCKIASDENGSRGYGFVHYEKEEEADEAIKKVNGMLLQEKQVYVGRFLSRKERDDALGTSGKKFNNVFAKNLPDDVDNIEKLEKLFSEFGSITSCVVMTDSDAKSKGFGFINFESPDAAEKAVEEMNGKKIGEKELFCGRAMKKRERERILADQFARRRAELDEKFQGVNLYVKNIDESVDDDKLREAFAEYGNITSAKIMKDKNGVTKGFGFVCYSQAEEATKAVTEMNQRIISGTTKPLYVALAQRKQDRRNMLSAQHNARLSGMRMQAPGPMQMAYTQAMGYYPPGPNMPNLAYRYPQMQQGPRFMNQQQIVHQQGMRMPTGMQNPMMIRPGVPVQGGMRGGNQGRGRGNQGRGKQQQQYTSQQARNMPQVQQASISGAAAAEPVPAVHAPGQEPLTASALAAASNPEQKQMLGERLFPLIQNTHPDLAGKITGMLLEMDNSELLHLLEDKTALNEKVTEAVQVLREHQAKVGGN